MRRIDSNLVERSWEWHGEWQITSCDTFSRDLSNPEVAHAYNLLYCQSTVDALPSDLSALLASDGIQRAQVAVTHGQWRFERWGRPSAKIGPSGFHSAATVHGYREFVDLIKILARFMGSSPSFDGRIVRDSATEFSITDAQEVLCWSHIKAFVALTNFSHFTPTQMLAAKFISLHFEFVKSTSSWHWQTSLVLIHKEIEQNFMQTPQFAIWQHVAPDSKQKGRIVIHATNPDKCNLKIRIVTPWFLNFDAVHHRIRNIDMHQRISETLEISTNETAPQIILEYQAKFIPDSQWPYDQFYGFELPPAFATCKGQSVFSESALIMLPETDRSMPFNIITLWSTIIAYTFGTIMTKLVHRLSHKSTSNNDDQIKKKEH